MLADEAKLLSWTQATWLSCSANGNNSTHVYKGNEGGESQWGSDYVCNIPYLNKVYVLF